MVVKREHWGSRIGVILAVAGSAVGLGNFLRFPGQAAQNGGGAFMLPYFISLLIVGIPLAWAEWTMGRYAGQHGFNSAPGIFSVLWRNRISKYFGVLALLIPLVIYTYYVVLESWCLGYAFYYLRGSLNLGADAGAYSSFFANFIGSDADGSLLTGESHLLTFILITYALNFVLIYRGVSKGIETFCKVAMPLMIVCALAVLIRVLTLDGQERTVVQGLGSMWEPRLDKLGNFGTWIAAAGQIFFSLSVGFGVIINYASYLRRNDDVVLSGLTACSVNEFFEVCLGGLITLPAAFIFLGPAVAGMGTFGLGFNALPNVFSQMPGGQFVGFLWFFMLFLAAITSSLSMLQPVIAFLEEGFGLKRRGSTLILGTCGIAGSFFVVYYSRGMLALDTLDFWVGNVFIVALALIQAFIYAWVFGIERGEEEAHRGAHLQIPRFVQYILKFVTPVFLLVILGGFLFTEGKTRWQAILREPVALKSILIIGVVIVALTAAVHFAGKKWEREGRFAK